MAGLSALETLLELQDHDSAADRLRHRRAHLPERSELADVEQAAARLDAGLADVGGRRDEAARHQQRLEDEVAGVEAKVGEVEKKLYGGSVNAPRELQALQADVESLKRRQSSLEDELLEVMEVREPLEVGVAGLQAERARLAAESDRLRAAIAEAEAAIDAELDGEQRARDGLAVDVPRDLLELYEQLRRKLGGVGAARLVGASCSGCHLTLPAQEVSRIRREPPDAVIRCDQCGRILVR